MESAPTLSPGNSSDLRSVLSRFSLSDSSVFNEDFLSLSKDRLLELVFKCKSCACVCCVVTGNGRRQRALRVLLCWSSAPSLRRCVRQPVWRETDCWSSLSFSTGGTLNKRWLVESSHLCDIITHVTVLYREGEAVQKCVEAEQKLQDERRRCVLLEQKLERLKLETEKAQRVKRSRTGTYCSGAASLQFSSSLTTVRIWCLPYLYVPCSMFVFMSLVVCNAGSVNLHEKQEGHSPRSVVESTHDTRFSELSTR